LGDVPGDRVDRRPRPGAQVGADQFEPGHDDERPDIQAGCASPPQKPEKAEKPDEPQHVWTRGRGDAPDRPAPAGRRGADHQGPPVSLHPGGASDRQRSQVHQPVPGRNVDGHRSQPVGVDLQQRGERVLHGGRDEHHDRGLGPHQRGFATQCDEQHNPGEYAQARLRGEPDGVRTGPVGDQHHPDPRHHRHRQRRVANA
jgi:hypothetical protein